MGSMAGAGSFEISPVSRRVEPAQRRKNPGRHHGSEPGSRGKARKGRIGKGGAARPTALARLLREGHRPGRRRKVPLEREARRRHEARRPEACRRRCTGCLSTRSRVSRRLAGSGPTPAFRAYYRRPVRIPRLSSCWANSRFALRAHGQVLLWAFAT